MHKDLTLKPGQFNRSFLSVEKDLKAVLKKLFIESRPYSDDLIRLLVINTPDCLDDKDNPVYRDIFKSMSLGRLKSEGYIKITPKLDMPEHEEVKSYIVITIDDFTENATNPQFRDSMITFHIICHADCWDLGDFRLRPVQIAGYIDGILDNCRLSGIGTLQFIGCKEIALSADLAGYSIGYRMVHGSDDKLPPKE